MVECVVVGAGVFGSWTALRLAESGRRVVLIDAFGPGNPKSSSGGASRVIRVGYGADQIYTRWAMRSLPAWRELPGIFQHTGVLWTARRGHPYGAGTIRTFRKFGVPHEILADEEVRRRYPAMHFEQEIIGIFEPESGALLANRAVREVALEAARIGVEAVEGAVIPFVEEGPLGHVVTDRGRTIEAAAFVFACGPWLPKLFPLAVGRRIRVSRQPVFYFDAPGIALPVWIDFTDPRGGYAIPPIDGKTFKLALDRHGTPFDPDSGSRAVTKEETAEARAFLAERFPALRNAPVVETEVCQYESTSSGDFLIDRHPAMPNVWLVGGGSGHGFKHGPAVGEYVASVFDGGEREERFSWESKLERAARTVF